MRLIVNVSTEHDPRVYHCRSIRLLLKNRDGSIPKPRMLVIEGYDGSTMFVKYDDIELITTEA